MIFIYYAQTDTFHNWQLMKNPNSVSQKIKIYYVKLDYVTATVVAEAYHACVLFDF